MNDVATFFLCLLAFYGMTMAAIDIWIWHRERRLNRFEPGDGYDRDFFEIDDAAEEAERMDELIDEICRGEFLPTRQLTGNSVEATAAPEGESRFDRMMTSHRQYLAGDPTGVPYLDPDDDEECEACAEDESPEEIERFRKLCRGAGLPGFEEDSPPGWWERHRARCRKE